MTIIITDKNNKTIKLDRNNFDNEKEVQKYIHENPESLPLYEIDEDIQLLILKREFLTNSGPADAIGIDNQGNIYIIETKLYKNSDKRNVLAQVLDYGASIWKNIDYQSFKNTLDDEVREKEKISLDDKIRNFFDFTEDEEIDELFKNLENNFNSAVFKFVVLMDKIDDRLKDLIIFMNQNTSFDIYGVEFDLYKFKGNKIIIPRLFGNEVKKQSNIKQTKKKQYVWDWESFSRERLSRFGGDVIKITKDILEFLDKNKIKYNYTKSERGGIAISFQKNKKKYYFFVVGGDGKIGWNIPHHFTKGNLISKPFDNEDKFKELLLKLNKINKTKINLDNIRGYKALDLDIKSLKNISERKKFFDILLWIKNELEKK